MSTLPSLIDSPSSGPTMPASLLSSPSMWNAGILFPRRKSFPIRADPTCSPSRCRRGFPTGSIIPGENRGMLSHHNPVQSQSRLRALGAGARLAGRTGSQRSQDSGGKGPGCHFQEAPSGGIEGQVRGYHQGGYLSGRDRGVNQRQLLGQLRGHSLHFSRSLTAALIEAGKATMMTRLIATKLSIPHGHLSMMVSRTATTIRATP